MCAKIPPAHSWGLQRGRRLEWRSGMEAGVWRRGVCTLRHSHISRRWWTLWEVVRGRYDLPTPPPPVEEALRKKGTKTELGRELPRFSVWVRKGYPQRKGGGLKCSGPSWGTRAGAAQPPAADRMERAAWWSGFLSCRRRALEGKSLLSPLLSRARGQFFDVSPLVHHPVGIPLRFSSGCLRTL